MSQVTYSPIFYSCCTVQIVKLKGPQKFKSVLSLSSDLFVSSHTVSTPYTLCKKSQEKAASFNTSISSEREAAWSHEYGSCVCVETKWMAAGWNCATVRLRIRAPMACGGTSGAKAGYQWHGSILTTTSMWKQRVTGKTPSDSLHVSLWCASVFSLIECCLYTEIL